MKIKVAIITKKKELINIVKEYLKTVSEIDITVMEKELSSEEFLKKKFDIVIFDKKINSNWKKVLEEVKFANINSIFILIVDKYLIEEVKEGFKNGIYEILEKDIQNDIFLSSLGKAIYSAQLYKSTEKIHNFCTHFIKFELPSDVNLVNETVLQILETAKIAGFIKDQNLESNLRLIYTEAIVNAIVHGNKSDNNKKVLIDVELTNKFIKVAVEDEGKGYNIESINNPLDEDNLLNSSGRGIYLIRTIADKIKLENNGRRIIIINLKKMEDKMG